MSADQDYLAAQIRLAKASDAWLTCQEKFEEIKAEYHAARRACVAAKARYEAEVSP